MSARAILLLLAMPAVAGWPLGLHAQVPVPAPPPATKLEGFKPAAGSVVTVGITNLGRVSGVSVEVRELRDGSRAPVRGLVVQVTETQYRQARSFVDSDEIPELLRGIDALLEVSTNPTSFARFQVRYATRGELTVTAFNSSDGKIDYAVDAGRGLKARRLIDKLRLRSLRTLFQTAHEMLGQQALGSSHFTQTESETRDDLRSTTHCTRAMRRIFESMSPEADARLFQFKVSMLTQAPFGKISICVIG